MRVLVIGGTEFIGRRIVELLVGRGDEVTVVHRGQTEPAGQAECEHLHVDRRDFSTIAAQVRQVDTVVDTHALSQADVDAVVPYLPDVPAVVLSSMDVYRHYERVLKDDWRPLPVPIDEDTPVRDGRYPYRGLPYGEDDYEKLDVEPAYLARGGTVLRLARIYGQHDPQRREEHVLRRVRAGRTEIPVGGGSTLWTSLHVDDTAAAVLAALDQPLASAGEVFNIGEATTFTMRARMELILNAAEYEATLHRVPDGALPDDLRVTRDWPQHLLVSSQKAMQRLAWQPSDPVESISRSVRWHLAHPPAEEQPDFAADDRALAARF